MRTLRSRSQSAGLVLAFLFTPLLLKCTTRATTNAGAIDAPATLALSHGLRIADQYRVADIPTRRFTHTVFWRAVHPSISTAALRTEEIGRSIQGREIRSVTFGNGDITVLLWSQMHGDESTATMALADIFRFLAEATGDPVRERLRERLTIVFVPMLNPDGAEIFERENAAGIDINRDARALATPEARALKSLRDRLRPDFGFNLHDQGARTLAGPRGPQAAIALLAPPASTDRRYNEVRSRARLVAATITRALADEIPGRIARYDDTFNPRAFGDLMQQWGTSTVLIESGALPNDRDKQRLRAINVAALLTALDAIATGAYAAADPDIYESLLDNYGGASDILLLGGQLVLPEKSPLRADVAITFDEPAARTGARVRAVGDLRETVAIDTVDVRGLFLYPRDTSLTRQNGGTWFLPGAVAVIDLRRAADPSSEIVRTVGGSNER
jgi:hypothetical protein